VRAFGAFEVQQEAVDQEVGVGADAGTGKGGPAAAVAGCGGLPQELKWAAGCVVELVDDVVHQILVGKGQQPLEGELLGGFDRGVEQRGVEDPYGLP
jgi:hypothetical protein